MSTGVLKLVYRSPTIKDLSFGGSCIAGIYQEVSHETATRTLQLALDEGFTAFDTAPLYGAGLSELYFGEVLTRSKHPLYISTKVGRIIKNKSECKKDDSHVGWDYEESYKLDGKPTEKVPVFDYSEEGTRESFRQSSERMKGIKISCLRLHDAETEEFFAEATKEGCAVDTLIQMRKEGLIKHISLGMNKADFLLRYIRKYPKGTWDNILVAGCWNLMDQSGECETKGISITLAGVFGSGLLWGGNYLRYVPAQQADIEKRDKWQALAAKHGCSLPGVALAFAFLPKCVSELCLGCKTPEQVEANLALLAEKVPTELWAEAKSEGLLPAWLTLPTN